MAKGLYLLEGVRPKHWTPGALALKFAASNEKLILIFMQSSYARPFCADRRVDQYSRMLPLPGRLNNIKLTSITASTELAAAFLAKFLFTILNYAVSSSKLM